MTQFIPKVKVSGNKNKFIWKKELELTMNTKHRLWIKYIETGNKKILDKYEELNNNIRNETREILKQEQRSIAESSKFNIKRFGII